MSYTTGTTNTNVTGTGQPSTVPTTSTSTTTGTTGGDVGAKAGAGVKGLFAKGHVSSECLSGLVSPS